MRRCMKAYNDIQRKPVLRRFLRMPLIYPDDFLRYIPDRHSQKFEQVSRELWDSASSSKAISVDIVERYPTERLFDRRIF